MERRAPALVSLIFILVLGIGFCLVSVQTARAASDISGTVTDEWGTPLESIYIEVYGAASGEYIDCTYSDVDGSYCLTVDEGQDYRLVFRDESGWHAFQWYSGANTFAAATDVSAPSENVDVQLLYGVSISGTVTEAGTGAPIESCWVDVYDPTLEISVQWSSTDDNGDYIIDGVPAGQPYRILFDDNSVHAPQWFNSKGSWSTADNVVAPASGVDAQLAETGQGIVSGVVTNGAGTPLEGIEVHWSTGYNIDFGATTGPDGSYEIAGLDTGIEYRFLFVDPEGDHALEWYSDASSYDDATPVIPSVTNVDAQLEPGAQVTGTLTAEDDGIPVSDYRVMAHDPSRNLLLPLATGITDASGYYTLRGLRSGGDCKIIFSEGDFGDSYWYHGRGSWYQADPVTAPAAGIDDAIPYAHGSTVTGNVTSGGVSPAQYVGVYAYDSQGDVAEVAYTDASGNYILDQLSESTDYRILFLDDSGVNALEWYSDAVDISHATTVVAPATDVDAPLEPGETISGRLTYSGSGEPVQDFYACWADPTQQILNPQWSAFYGTDGYYTIGGFRSGTQVKVFFATGWYEIKRWYHGASAWSNAQLVTAPASDRDDTITEYQPPPYFEGITPKTAVTGSLVSITDLAGQDFVMEGETLVRLKRGSATVNATDVDVVSTSRITCKFDLAGAQPGLWDVEIENPDGQICTGTGAFTVLAPPSVSSVDPTLGPPGTLVVIKGSNFGNSRGLSSQEGTGAGASSYVSFNGVKGTEYPRWTDKEICVKLPDGASAGPVTVTTAAGSSPAGATFDVCSPTWYLAEGTSDWGFDTYVTIENPNTTTVKARVTYMTKAGPKEMDEMTLPPLSQSTINPRNAVGATDFSTRVVCTTRGKTIAVDRRMIWTGREAKSPEGHSSVGVPNPDTRWYLPEGSSKWGFECWLLIQNPNGTDARCSITYMVEGGAPVTWTKTVPASSRASFSMFEDIGAADASIMVQSNVPVIPERAMYRNGRREGHDSIGTTSPACDYYLAEGSSDWGFTSYVLVQNPNSSVANVSITFMADDGPHPLGMFQMPANSRRTLRVNDLLPSKDFSTHVHADRPIVAERAMYWDKGWGEACHDSIGMPLAHKVFYLPDGETQNGYETYTLVQNPNDTNIDIKIEYLLPGGAQKREFTVTMRADSRATFSMQDLVPNGRASIKVTCLTQGKKIMCERAMYWNGRGAGTDTIGGYSD